MARLENKVAIVTGAATGIGRATAMLYAREGAKVVVADTRTDEGEQVAADIRAAGGAAVFAPTNVADSSAVKACVAFAEAEFGALHIMTANAGIIGRGGKKQLVDLSDDEIREIMAVNFEGVLWSFQHAIPAIRRAGGGAMTATASMAAHRAKADLPIYSASKGAVVALSRSLAAALKPDNIRVNVVSPGAVRTSVRAHTAELMGLTYEEYCERAGVDPEETRIDVSEPVEQAQAHLFFVSDDASFVTGQTMMVDGGAGI